MFNYLMISLDVAKKKLKIALYCITSLLSKKFVFFLIREAVAKVIIPVVGFHKIQSISTEVPKYFLFPPLLSLQKLHSLIKRRQEQHFQLSKTKPILFKV